MAINGSNDMQTNIIEFPAVTQSCGDCDWADCCVSRGLSHDRNKDPESSRTIAYRRNDHLFLQGDVLNSLYFLRSGSAKSVVSTRSGSERIVGFHFPGDLIGFDGMTSGHHQSTTIALDTSGVCRVPLSKLKSESVINMALLEEVLRSVANEVGEKQNYGLLLGQKSVHARFAAFLCYLSSKYASRGCSGAEFNLSMSRQDIANYLSMAVETLSRLIGDFQEKGLVKVERRFVRITDVRALKEISQADNCAAVSYG
ncbi:MAG: CRP/FNR family transcriptional regulator [Gammaproteobacteria bacterium]|jgi:CRP/FNR family transcriptional regulator